MKPSIELHSKKKDTREKVSIATRKDFDISYYIGPGDGGQNKQKNSTGVQIIHRETGAIGRCHDTRSQVQNRKKAFIRLCETPKMKFWISQKVYEVQTGKTTEDWVNEQMAPHNLKIEYYDPNERTKTNSNCSSH